MFVGVLKMTFEKEFSEKKYMKDTANLCIKIRKTFKVLVASESISEKDAEIKLVVLALNSRKNVLSQLFHTIMGFCEKEGFGRILTEDLSIRHIDCISS